MQFEVLGAFTSRLEPGSLCDHCLMSLSSAYGRSPNEWRRRTEFSREFALAEGGRTRYVGVETVVSMHDI